MDYMVEFLDGRDRLIGEEEVFERRNIAAVLDSVRTRVMHDPDLMQDCTGMHIQKIAGA